MLAQGGAVSNVRGTVQNIQGNVSNYGGVVGNAYGQVSNCEEDGLCRKGEARSCAAYMREHLWDDCTDVCSWQVYNATGAVKNVGGAVQVTGKTAYLECDKCFGVFMHVGSGVVRC